MRRPPAWLRDALRLRDSLAEIEAMRLGHEPGRNEAFDVWIYRRRSDLSALPR